MILLITFPFRCHLFLCLAQLLSTILNERSESGHPCLILDLRGKVFNLSPVEYDVRCESIIYGFYNVEVCSFFVQFDEDFYHEKMVYFIKCVSPSIEMII